jgi:hypothetical protein
VGRRARAMWGGRPSPLAREGGPAGRPILRTGHRWVKPTEGFRRGRAERRSGCPHRPAAAAAAGTGRSGRPKRGSRSSLAADTSPPRPQHTQHKRTRAQKRTNSENAFRGSVIEWTVEKQGHQKERGQVECGDHAELVQAETLIGGCALSGGALAGSVQRDAADPGLGQALGEVRLPQIRRRSFDVLRLCETTSESGSRAGQRITTRSL